MIGSLFAKLFHKSDSHRRIVQVGRDGVRVEIGSKVIFLQGELCKDDVGYFVFVATPFEMVWKRPPAVPVSEEERKRICETILDRNLWPPGERYVIL